MGPSSLRNLQMELVFGAVFHGEDTFRSSRPIPPRLSNSACSPSRQAAHDDSRRRTFSFTDGLLDEVGKQVKWKDGGATDELYAKRQQEREDIGAEYLPRVFKGVMSADRKTHGYFLRTLKDR